MKNYLIAERYAQGLNQSIADESDLDTARKALEALSALYQENNDLRNALSNPALDSSKRKAVLHDTMAAMGLPAVVARLAELLVQRGRITLLPDVAEVFAMFADRRLNRVTARVTSAGPLDESQQARVQAALSKHTDRTVSLKCKVDPELLGGVVARLGDRVFDGSLRTRLNNLRNTLLADG